MKANDLFEVRFRAWLKDQTSLPEPLTKGEAINGGAEAIGCSVQTAAHYLAKATSKEGPYRELKDALRTTLIVTRAPRQTTAAETAPPTMATETLPPPGAAESPPPRADPNRGRRPPYACGRCKEGFYSHAAMVAHVCPNATPKEATA